MGTDKLDDWLDQALSNYSRAEARVGLEQRVLANLDAEMSRAGAQYWWRALAVVTFAGIVAALWFVVVRHSQTPPIIARQLTAPLAKRTLEPVKPASQSSVPSTKRQKVPRTVTTSSARMQPPDHGSSPKLDQFPSARPLSDQEKLLIAYVRQAKTPLTNSGLAGVQIEPLQVNPLVGVEKVTAISR